jgi:hypothetical protein
MKGLNFGDVTSMLSICGIAHCHDNRYKSTIYYLLLDRRFCPESQPFLMPQDLISSKVAVGSAHTDTMQ